MCHRLIPYYRQLETKHRNEEKKRTANGNLSYCETPPLPSSKASTQSWKTARTGLWTPDLHLPSQLEYPGRTVSRLTITIVAYPIYLSSPFHAWCVGSLISKFSQNSLFKCREIVRGTNSLKKQLGGAETFAHCCTCRVLWHKHDTVDCVYVVQAADTLPYFPENFIMSIQHVYEAKLSEIIYLTNVSNRESFLLKYRDTHLLYSFRHAAFRTNYGTQLLKRQIPIVFNYHPDIIGLSDCSRCLY